MNYDQSSPTLGCKHRVNFPTQAFAQPPLPPKPYEQVRSGRATADVGFVSLERVSCEKEAASHCFKIRDKQSHIIHMTYVWHSQDMRSSRTVPLKVAQAGNLPPISQLSNDRVQYGIAEELGADPVSHSVFLCVINLLRE